MILVRFYACYSSVLVGKEIHYKKCPFIPERKEAESLRRGKVCEEIEEVDRGLPNSYIVGMRTIPSIFVFQFTGDINNLQTKSTSHRIIIFTLMVLC